MRAMRKRPAGRRHSGRELQGRMGPGPGRDQRPLCRRADDGRPPRRSSRTRCKEIAHAAGQGRSPSWPSGTTTSPAQSSHIHKSLWDAKGKKPLFLDAKAELGMSHADAALRRRPAQVRARHHLFPRALHQFLQALPGRHLRADQGDLEPRQPHRRLPPVRRGQQGDPHRVPHRRRRPQSLSRLRRAARGRPRRHRGEARARRRLPGDAYAGEKLPEVPRPCARPPRRSQASKMLRAALGDEVVDHYVHTAEWEQFEYDRRITDWELKRGFERY